MTDAAGNIIYESKTIKVPEGFMTGGGQITTGKGKTALKVSYAGNVGFLADFSLLGQWQVKFHNVGPSMLDGAKFHSTEIKELQFYNTTVPDDPSPPAANANLAFFVTEGRLNGEDGWTMRWVVLDSGEPGVDDAVAFSLWNPAGGMVYYQKDDFPNTLLTYDSAPEDLDPFFGSLFTTRASGNLQIHSGVK